MYNIKYCIHLKITTFLGFGSWQGWNYRFAYSLKNEKNWKRIDTNTTEIIIDSLPNTTYIIKVAAYSSSGLGPWSSVFVVKTLSRNVSVLWGNAHKILMSDPMGDYIIDSITLNKNEVSIKIFLLLILSMNFRLKISIQYTHKFLANKFGMSSNILLKFIL